MAQNTLATRTGKRSQSHSASELIKPSDPRAGIVSIDPALHSGTPCFAGTRVPIRDLWDYLEGGETLDTFLDSFPTVSREQAVRALQLALGKLLVVSSAK